MTVQRQLGQVFRQERTIALGNRVRRFTDQLSATNRTDLWQFSLRNRSRLNLTLRNLQGNARIQILDADRNIIPTPVRVRQRDASLQKTLDRGNYYLRVIPNNRNRSIASGFIRYALQASVQRSTEPTVEPAAGLFVRSTAPAAQRFNIEFDYRFDTAGWFTAERRAALEAAATVWENLILDEFPTTPRGTRTPFVIDPSTGRFVGINNEFITDRSIDDLVIFVGSRELEGAILALGGPSGHFSDESRYMGDDYQPWLGTISFDSGTNWFFDRTPTTADDLPQNRQDFISTAIHEIGHVLGFNSSVPAFRNQISNRSFIGSNAVSRNGGQGIPLDASGAHVQEGYEFGDSGEMLMDPLTASGTRQLPTILDIAVLDDIGYRINYNFASRNVSNRTLDRNSSSIDRPRTNTTNAWLPIARCGCSSCLVRSSLERSSLERSKGRVEPQRHKGHEESTKRGQHAPQRRRERRGKA